MKKNFITKFAIVVVLATMTIPAMSQKIVYDNVDSETGIRSVSTDDIICRSTTDKIVLKVSIASIIEKQDTTLYLCMTLDSNYPISANKGSRMLIKLMNDDVMEFTAFSEQDDQIGDISRYGGVVYKTYSISPMYDITKEELAEIAIKGVKKVRIECAPDYYDKEFQKDKVGAAIKKLYPVLKKDIETPKSFDADF